MSIKIVAHGEAEKLQGPFSQLRKLLPGITQPPGSFFPPTREARTAHRSAIGQADAIRQRQAKLKVRSTQLEIDLNPSALVLGSLRTTPTA